MRTATVYLHDKPVAELREISESEYELHYLPKTDGKSISLTIPFSQTPHKFSKFPPFFEGLLPEGAQLQALLRQYKIDEKDYFSQLMAVGGELVGAVTVQETNN